MEGEILGFSVDVQQDFLMDGADGAVGHRARVEEQIAVFGVRVF